MEYRDQNEYERRIEIIHEIATQHPELLKSITAEDREQLQKYFLDARKQPKRTEYRHNLIKETPTIELSANKAYERFLAEAGLPETLPHQS